MQRSVLLQTPRLVLREFREDDWLTMYRVDADPVVKRYLPSDPLTEEGSKESVLWCIEQAQEGTARPIRPRRRLPGRRGCRLVPFGVAGGRGAPG